MPIRAEARIDIARTPDEVFDFVAVRWFENLRRWSEALIEVTPLSPGAVGLGTRGVEVRRTRVGKQRAQPHGRTFEVTLFDPPRSFAVTGVEDGGPGSGYSRRYDFAQLGSRTRVWYRFEQEMEIGALNIAVLYLLSPITRFRRRRELGRDLGRLREAMEAR